MRGLILSHHDDDTTHEYKRMICVSVREKRGHDEDHEPKPNKTSSESIGRHW